MKALPLILCSAFFVVAMSRTVAATPRVEIGLNTQWKFIRDDVPGAESFRFNDRNWITVSLPHTWNNVDGQDGGNDYYRGVGWYRRHLKIDQRYAGRSLFLKFDGAATVADVFVNGKLAGQHRGNFAAFCFDVTSLLRVGRDNVIAVKVNNALNPDIPPLSGDFTIFGGLYRGARLLVLDRLSITPLDYASPGVYLKQTRVTPEAAELEITTKLRNANDAAKRVTVRCTISDADGKNVTRVDSQQEIAAHGSSNVVQTITLTQPHLWDGRADPYLYKAVVEVRDGNRVVDAVTQPLGLRCFRVDSNEGFFLNGTHYPLRGVNRHQDRLDLGWAIGPAEHQEDFNLITEMGCTAVRLAHYQHAQDFYDLCDRGGLVVWAELSLVNQLGESPAFADNARVQLTELIKQNYNHPSIVFWSLFNELRFKDALPETAECELISELNQLAKSLDPTRLTAAASCCLPATHPSNKITDVLGFNRYHGWYRDEIEDWPAQLDALHQALPDRGLGISEYGAGASVHQHEPNPHKPEDTVSPWHPEEWQSAVHEAAWKAMKERRWLWGTFVWNMFDFAADARREGDHLGRNDKGLVTYDRKVKKDAFYWYKANWTTDPLVYITSRRFADRTQALTPVKIYSNCDEVTLKVNGTSYPPVRSDDRIFVWNDVALKPGENRIEAFASKGDRSVTDSCAWIYRPAR